MRIRKPQEPETEPQRQPNRAERRRWVTDIKRQMRTARAAVAPVIDRERALESENASVMDMRLD